MKEAGVRHRRYSSLVYVVETARRQLIARRAANQMNWPWYPAAGGQKRRPNGRHWSAHRLAGATPSTCPYPAAPMHSCNVCSPPSVRRRRRRLGGGGPDAVGGPRRLPSPQIAPRGLPNAQSLGGAAYRQGLLLRRQQPRFRTACVSVFWAGVARLTSGRRSEAAVSTSPTRPPRRHRHP